MRIVTTNRRSNKNGAIKTGHNDRTFDISKADHIDKEKASKNPSWTWNGSKSQEESEQSFYEEFFGKGLEARNERYIKQRHKEKVRTIQDMRADPKQCLEEGIRQIGKHGDDVDPKTFMKIMYEYLQWKEKTFPLVKTVNAYIHLDEPNAQIHMHERSAYLGKDKDGNYIPSQNKALKEMGIELPEPKKAEGRYNNRKITFDKMCREHFAEICKAHGIDIELEPKDKSQSGLSLLQLKAKTAQEEAERAEQAQKEAEQKKQAAEAEKKKIVAQIDDLEFKQLEVEMELEQQQQKLKSSTITEKERQLQAEVQKLKQEIKDKDNIIEDLKDKLRRATTFLKELNLVERYKKWKNKTQEQEHIYER